MEKIKAILLSGKIFSNSEEARALLEKSNFGEKFGEKIYYSLPETLYLVEKNKMDVFDYRDKKISKTELTKRLERIDKKLKLKYLVFKDLREKGYVVKTALKFGAEFRVYEKGKKVGKSHSKWLVLLASETKPINWHEFTAKNRVAHSTKKNLLIAIVDEENDVLYYETRWLQP